MCRGRAGAAGARADAGEAGGGGGRALDAGADLRPVQAAGAARRPATRRHVTNAKDDPLQLAADAAIAVALGFDEIETTMRVARQWLVERAGLRRGRGGRARRHAVPVLDRGGRGAEDRHGRLHLLRRDGVGLRHGARPSSMATTRRGRRRSSRRPTRRAGSRRAARPAPGSELLMGFHSRSRCSIWRRAASACSGAWACRARRTAASTARRSQPRCPAACAS